MGFKIWKYCLILGIFLQTILTGEEPYTAVQDTAAVPILNPALSQRQTLKLRLSNGLEAYLISDPQATQSGAVLTVQAGSWDDPEEYPGIAHFLEHMLFLGTEKYPIESDYDHFIRGHDGRSNAYTTNDYTLYLFAIRPDALEEALDRFSFFFKKPLFNPSGVSRELRAIDQEFAKNFNQDSFRELHVGKELANTQHPFHQFSIGNSATLSKVTQQVLRQWYQEHYSAHLMRLIVYAPYPMETLKSWVIQDFKDIPSTWHTLSRPQVPLLAEEMGGKIAYIESVKDVRNLNLTWELPLSLAHSPSFRPEKLICSILGYEGEGSLLANLKAEGLAEELSCTSSPMGKNHLLFSLSIDLTQEGLKKIPQVIEESFQAIQMLQEQDLPSYLFEEFKKIHTIHYQYQSKEDAFQYLMQMGGQFVYEDLSTFPESVFIPQNYDPKIVREFLDYLTPQHAHFAVLARQPSMTFDRTEQWVGVPYKVTTFSSEQLTAWSHLPSHPHLHLPPPNPFLPQDLKLVNAAQPQHTLFDPVPLPLLLVDDPQAKIYFSADDRFQIPQTLWFFEIKTPLIKNNDPLKVVLTDLYIKSLEEDLQPYSYPAKVADLSYQISRSTNGLSLSLYGYRDKAENLFDAILERIKNCHPSETAFHNMKDSLLRQYRDFDQESPLEQGQEAYQTILYQARSTHQQQADALQQLSYETFLSFIDHLFDQTYVEGLLYGNIHQKQALQVWQKLQTVLASQIYPREQQLNDRAVVLPAHSGPYMVEVDVQSPAHAVILGVEEPAFSFKARAAQQILAQAMSSAFYSTLRTQQQTCYLIYSRAQEVDKRLFTFFAVQSTTHDPRDLLARFELFIEGFLEGMEKHELTRENFENIRQALADSLECPPQNLTDMGYLLKTLAFKYEGDFNWVNKQAQGFKELTYEEFLNIAKQSLGKDNKRRLALLIRGATDEDFHYESLSSLQDMRRLAYYPSVSEKEENNNGSDIVSLDKL